MFYNNLESVAVESFRFGFAGVVCQHSLYTVNVAAGKRLLVFRGGLGKSFTSSTGESIGPCSSKRWLRRQWRKRRVVIVGGLERRSKETFQVRVMEPAQVTLALPGGAV